MSKNGTWCVVSAFLVFWCVAHVGGNFNNGTNAGLWHWNCNNTSTTSNLNNGARLLICVIIIFYYTSFSLALAKNIVATGLV